MRTNRKAFTRLLLAGALVLGVAACSDDDTSGGSTATDAPASSEAPATTGGGSEINQEPLKIGVAAITLQSPAVGVQIDTINRAAELLGWEVEVLNADGDPAEMAAIVSAFVNKDVDAILDIAISPAQAQQGMQAAKEKGIPVIAIGAPLEDPQGLLSATYAPDDAAMSVLLAEQMMKDYPDGGKALSLQATGLPALEIRTATLTEETAGSGIEIGEAHETDMSNPVQDTQTAVANALRANPDINIIWAVQDFEFLVTKQTIEAQGLQAAGIYSYYPPPEALQALRDWKEGDAPLAVADSPIEFVPWYAIDALINKFVLGQENWVTDMSIIELPVVLMTPADVPDGDAYPFEEFEPFFVARWEDAGLTLNK